MKPCIIAIDGPAGAGKSTVAREVAEKLGYLYLDTGAMYRVIALEAIRQNVSLEDERLTQLAAKTVIDFRLGLKGERLVFSNNVNVTEAIRSPEVTKLVSRIAAVPGVRSELVAQQRQIGNRKAVVLDGRDIGTVVFPDAEVKIFLTASVEERARRRWLELTQKGSPAVLTEIAADISARDQADMTRATSPLVQAKDAYFLDSSKLSPEEVVNAIIAYCEERNHAI